MDQNNSSTVKNYQSDFIIKKMYEKSFHTSPINIVISKLSGGLKNAVYLIEDNGKKIVLKIGPRDESKMITADRGILWWEAEMLKLMEKINFPAPKLFHYAEKDELCSSPYMFMSYIPGKNYLENKNNMSSKEIENIENQLGQLSAKICSITSDKFFLPSQPEKKFSNNYEFILNLFDLLLNDAKERNMDLGKYNYDIIRETIKKNKKSLNNINKICLCHTDIWDGNVIVDKGNVSGIVDFTDLYYCDELMTFYFHTIDGVTSKNFLKGFNNKKLNFDEKVRIEIYRMYVILKMIVDCELKQYGKFDWMYQNLEKRVDGLQRIRK